MKFDRDEAAAGGSLRSLSRTGAGFVRKGGEISGSAAEGIGMRG